MMSTMLRTPLLAAAAFWLAAPGAVMAQQAQYAPVMARFSGSGSLLLPPMSALDINGYGTIEFWVAAKWTADPGYDPAIMAYTGGKGARFAVVITSDRQGLGVSAGPNYAVVPFDFSDGELHYVALTTVGDTIAVLIDGEQQAVLDYGFANLPANRFSIGSMGQFSPFIGEIGQVRIWDDPIDPDTLANFSWRTIAATGPNAHPDIEALVGVSAFANPETGGFVFVGDAVDPETVAGTLADLDDTGLGIDDPELNPPGN